MSYPFIASRWFTPGRYAPVTLIVVHTIECPLEVGMAKAAADLCARRDEKISAHYFIDPATVIQGVKESDTAYCAPGANHNGIHIEQSGRASLTTAQWHEPKAVAQHQVMAALIADISVRRNIPLGFLYAADLVAQGDAATGVTTHWEVSKAFHKTDHTDPGPYYPLDYVLIEARALLNPPKEDDDMPAKTIRKTSTGAIEVYANGVAAPFHFADPNDAARNVATINRLAAKGLITVPWVELDDDEFDAIPRLA